MQNKTLIIFATPVTPFAGVWIEMNFGGGTANERIVTPFAGVWIEIVLSFPSSTDQMVTPFAGVWIEIFRVFKVHDICQCHSLRGSVD